MVNVQIYKGESLAITVPYENDRDETWTYTMMAASATEALPEAAFTVAPQPSELEITVLSTATETWEADTYQLQLKAVKDANTVIRNVGCLVVLPSLFVDGEDAVNPSSTVQEPKSWREQVLEKAQQVLLTAAGSSELSVNVGEFSTSFESKDRLMAFIRALEREIHAAEYGVEQQVIELEL